MFRLAGHWDRLVLHVLPYLVTLEDRRGSLRPPVGQCQDLRSS